VCDERFHYHKTEFDFGSRALLYVVSGGSVLLSANLIN